MDSNKKNNCHFLLANKGFTLPELMAVILIAGVLSVIVFGAFNSSRAGARDSRRLADIKEIQIGLALYYDKYRVYPLSTSGNIKTDLDVLRTEGNLPSIPVNPQGGLYEYKVVTGQKSYCIGTLMEVSRTLEGFSNCALNSSGAGATDLWYKTVNPQ